MANFNLVFDSGNLIYSDAKGNTVVIAGSAIIAPAYSKKTYSANSVVTHNGKLYTNSAAIETAEDWTAAHWTETTVAELL